MVKIKNKIMSFFYICMDIYLNYSSTLNPNIIKFNGSLYIVDNNLDINFK